MGQRLVISVYDEQHKRTPLCNIYYHWSAYSISALGETMKLLDYFDGKYAVRKTDFMSGPIDLNNQIARMINSSDTLSKFEVIARHSEYLNSVFGIENTLDFCTIDDPLLRIIRIMEFFGGGLTPQSRSYAQNLYGDSVIFKSDSVDRNFGLVAIEPSDMKDSQQWSEGDVTIRLKTRGHHQVTSDVFYWTDDSNNINRDDCCKIAFTPGRPFDSSKLPKLIETFSDNDGMFISSNGTVFGLIE